jgi:hypothetical protein
MSTEHNNAADLEKGVTNGAGHTADPEAEHAAALQKIRTAGSITISPELFEKLYLSPEIGSGMIYARPLATQHRCKSEPYPARATIN